MSEDTPPAAAGWYPVPKAAEGRRQVRYWDGTEWTGAERRAGSDGSQPRDIPGRVAIILLCAGFLGYIAVQLVESLEAFSLTSPTIPAGVYTIAEIVFLATTPLAAVSSFVGLARGNLANFKTPVSLVLAIVSALGTVFVVLPILAFLTGAISLHI